jgi:hypothetical protein
LTVRGYRVKRDLMDRPQDQGTPGVARPAGPQDGSLIAELARMSPAERLRLNDAAVRAALKLREAARRAGA